METKINLNKKSKVLLGSFGALALTVIAAGGAFVSANNSTTKSQTFIDRVAELAGVDSQKLTDSMKQASKENIDQDVKDGKLTQEQADKIKEDIDAGKFGGFGMKGMHPERAMFIKENIEELATFLGISSEDLITKQRDEDKTLTQIAKEQGKSEEDLKNFLSTQFDTNLAKAVADEKITQEQADKMKENKDEMITRRMSDTGPKGKGDKFIMRKDKASQQ